MNVVYCSNPLTSKKKIKRGLRYVVLSVCLYYYGEF